MAQVTNVTLSIGNSDVAGSRSFTVFTPPDTRRYRTVTVAATLKFTPEEVGLRYRLNAALYATDRETQDPDDGIPMIFFDENSGIKDLENMTSSDNFFLYRKAYQEIIVNNTVMPITLSKPVLYDTLNEDPKVEFGGQVPDITPFINIHKDELFARVWLSSVAESSVLSVKLF